MHFDASISVGNILSLLVMLVTCGGYLCKVANSLELIRRELRWITEDAQEQKRWNAQVHALIEDRLKVLEAWQAREEGRRERGG